MAALAAHEEAGRTVTLLAPDDGVLGVFAVADTIKPSSREAVADLRRLGVAPVMLSGDNPATALAIAHEAGIAKVLEAAGEARRPLVFSKLIIMMVYLPIFALTGVEGRMFHPMAFMAVAALLGAMLLTVTFVPAAVALLLTARVAEKDNLPTRAARRLYEPLLGLVLPTAPSSSRSPP